MKTFRLLLAPVLGAILALPAPAAPIPLEELSTHIEDLVSVRGSFTQVNGDGTVMTGKILLKRPGRMRFEYDPPDRTLVIAGSGQVAIFDGKSNTGPEQYPLRRTPLSIILAKDVDLTRTDAVAEHREDGNMTVVTLHDPEHPEYGNIQLFFAANPARLSQWIVTDGGGARTTVILGDLEHGANISEGKFNILHEADARRR